MVPSTSQPQETPREAVEPSLVDEIFRVWGVIRRGWVYPFVTIAVFLTLAGLYFVRTRESFKGFARLLVLQQGGTPLTIGVSGDNVSNTATEDYIPTHILIIRSPIIIKSAIERAGLDRLDIPTVLDRLAVIRPEPGAKILEISYVGESREEARRLITEIVAGYREFLRKNYQNKANEVIELITNASETLDAEIRDLERKYVEFHKNHPVVAATEDGRSLDLRRLDQIDAAHNQAMFKEVQLKSQLELGRKLASEGKGMWAIASALKVLGDGAELSGASERDETIDLNGKSLEEIQPKLLIVRERRETAERLLGHLKSQSAEHLENQPPSEAELESLFYNDNDARQLREQLKTATRRRDAAKRTTRNSNDPSLQHAQRNLKAIREELDALFRSRRPALLETLAKDRSTQIANAIEAAESDLIVQRAQEKVLDERFESLGGDRSLLEASSSNDRAVVAEKAAANTLLESIDASVKAIEAMRLRLKARFDEDLSRSKESQVDRLTESNLRSNLDRARSMYNSVVEQLKQAELVSDYSSINAETLQEPEISPVRPKPAIIMAIGLLLGMIVGVGFAFLADLLDSRIHTVPEIRRALDLRVLGLIPQVPHPVDRLDEEIGLICMKAPRSMIAEAYKSIRTNLEFQRRLQPLNVLLVTSPHPGDGKSTCASNIAISLALAGRSVLLVDADLRRPSQHLLYRLEQERGLVHYLKKLLPIHMLTQPTPVEHLDILCAGPSVANPAELLASTAFEEFLQEARLRYDYVIIDSSPLLAVTDPSIIGSRVDGVVLIVRANSIRRHDAERALEMLKVIGVPVIGAVINGVTRDNVQTGAEYRYGYGYGYGQYGSEETANVAADSEPPNMVSFPDARPPRALIEENPSDAGSSLDSDMSPQFR